MSGCNSAASDHDFGPFTNTSTNRTALFVIAQPAFRLAGSGSTPATHASYASPVSGAASTAPRRSVSRVALGDSGAFSKVVVVRAAAVGLHIVARGSGRSR